LPVIILPGEFVELARKPFCFFLQVLSALVTTTATAALLLLLGPALHELLLTFCKFLQFLKGLIDGLGALVHFSALERFVLILVLIEFEFEMIRPVCGAL